MDSIGQFLQVTKIFILNGYIQVHMQPGKYTIESIILMKNLITSPVAQ